jgi:hypothetical protein
MLLWADGFDHYGTDETNMLDGVYAEAHANLDLSTTFFATGTHSYHVDSSGGAAERRMLRKVLPTAVDKIGVAGRFYFPNMPHDGTTGIGATIFAFLTSSAGTSQVSCIVDANGCLRFSRGCSMAPGASSGTAIAQTDPLITAASWNHVEVQIYIHDTLGWIRVAINGVHRFEALNLDTKHNTSNIVSVGQITNDIGTDDFYFDDYIIYDFTGTAAVDTDFCPSVDVDGVGTNYIAELQCMYLPPNGDTAEADWTKSTGTDGFALVDEVSPNDLDYISAAAAGDLSEFDLTDLPEDITYIRGLQLIGRMSKSDAGAAMTKFGMKSDAATDDADERPLTVEPTYWWDFMNVDPDSGARWTRASLNAAKFRITRSV